MSVNRAKLRELREKKGLPAAALDEIFGIQRGHWMNWENGFSDPEPELLEEIADYFGVKESDLTQGGQTGNGTES